MLALESDVQQKKNFYGTNDVKKNSVDKFQNISDIREK